MVCDHGVSVKDFLRQNAPEVNRLGVRMSNDDSMLEYVLEAVNFPEAERENDVNSLSAGWKMRLSVAISMLHEPELLLLDEPTNHLDREAIEWMTAHMKSLKGVTIICVSHDYDFIDSFCTDITHYDNTDANGHHQLGKPCRFVYYPCTFGEFQRIKPEIAAGLPRIDHKPAAPSAPASDAGSDSASACSSDGPSSSAHAEQSVSATIAKVDEMIAMGLILPMNMPDPGKPEGIRTYRKPILTLKDVSFKYPETERNILEHVTCQLTLGSRTVIVGGNGAGKSTFLKLIIGDLEAEAPNGTGTVWKHHNLRLSNVAQQSLHHLEDYVTLTPIHYIQERFRLGLDEEVKKLKTIQITAEEREQMLEIGAVQDIVGRQERGRKLWYEVLKRGRTDMDTQYFPQEEIEMRFPPYVKKLIKNFDQKQQALDSGMAIRPITGVEVLKHLIDFGIDSQLAHGKIRQMSGGQRQRLVLCAAFWSKPHVIALDEPTNYLDNDSVAALTKALKDFKGAVVTVSENEAFVEEISNEKWVVEHGRVEVVQLRDAKKR